MKSIVSQFMHTGENEQARLFCFHYAEAADSSMPTGSSSFRIRRESIRWNCRDAASG